MNRESGIYLGIPFADYIADALAVAPSLNAGTAATILEECPRAGWFGHSRLNPSGPGKKTKAQDVGTICHAILLEGDLSKVAVIDPQDYVGPRGGIPKGWTTDAIKAARDAARADGKIPVLADDFADIQAMVDSAQEFIRTSELSDIWPGTDREVTLLWEESGIWLRSRPDSLTKDRLIVTDVKTTAGSANPAAWGRAQIEGHNEIQAALGVRGLRNLVQDLRDEPRYVWLVIEQKAPFLCSLVGPDPAQMELAEEKVEDAIEIWRRCMSSGRWPAYGGRINWYSPPVYVRTRWEERESLDARAGGKMLSAADLDAGIPA